MTSTSPYNLRHKKPSPRKPIKKRHNDSSSDIDKMTESEDESFESRNESYDEPDCANVSRNMSSISDQGSYNSSKRDINYSARSHTTSPQKRGSKSKETEWSTTPKPAPKPQQRQKPDKKQTNNKSTGNIKYLVIILSLPIIVAMYMYFVPDNIPVKSENVPMLIETFMADMNHIKSRFPSQTRRFWKIVRVSLQRIIKENDPDYPAVLLLVVPSGSQSSKTGTCIAKQLTKIINTLYNVTSAKIIDIPSDIGHTTPDDEKKDLDIQIKNSFENEHFRSIAVDHFEQLSPRASLLFHGYCDGDNAPFKNVAIVFILHTNLHLQSLQGDPKLIDKYLMELWSSSDSPLDRDKIEPLLARVANNAAVITAEDNLNCY